MKNLIKLEELALFLFSVYLFSQLSFAWWVYPLFFFAPDLSIVGYLAGPRFGAVCYNLIHHKAVALATIVLGSFLGATVLSLAGVILLGHSSLDRVLGYGLKTTESFNQTSLGTIGQKR